MFDTVGSVGMPEELCLSSEKLKNIFGFPDKHLGHHVERAYQALALNETRKDFVSSCAHDSVLRLPQYNDFQDCAKFEQTSAGRERGQILKQVSPSLSSNRSKTVLKHPLCSAGSQVGRPQAGSSSVRY